MKLLVTGGAGFIGSNFILYWMKKYPNDKIFNLDKLTYAGNLDNLNSVKDSPNYKFIKGDICDKKTVEEVMKKVDKVVHFAAESHVDRSILGPAEFVKTNVLGTQILLSAAQKFNIKHFHHVSTDEVFGSLELDSSDKFKEDSPIQPNSPYAASKAGSDCLARAWVKTYGLKVTVTNTSNNFGPYQFPEKFIPLIITNLLENKPVPVYGDGKQVRDWIYVEDHCRAIDLVLEKGKRGDYFLIGGLTGNICNLEVVEKIVDILGKNKNLIKFVKDRPGHDVRYSIDWTKAKRELGYKPKFDFDSYLEKTVEWYQDNKKWWQRVKSGKYQDYYQEWYGSKFKN